MGQNKEACEIVTEAKAEDYRPVWGFVSLVKPMIQNISMIFIAPRISRQPAIFMFLTCL